MIQRPDDRIAAVVDPQRNKPLVTPEEVAEAECRANSPGRWYTTAEALAHLRSHGGVMKLLQAVSWSAAHGFSGGVSGAVLLRVHGRRVMSDNRLYRADLSRHKSPSTPKR